jgi:hypothetical protein
MNRNETPASRPPLFCSSDGYTLVDRSDELHDGFDAFTGKARPPRPHVTKQCPQYDGHPVWVLSGDKWLRLA